MKRSVRWWCVLGTLLAGVLGNTIGADLAPADAEQALQARVMMLAADLRCVVCQNQSLADSSASLAVDLRGEIAAMLRAGKSERDVTEFMAQRYGDFVLYSPPLQPTTWLLWLGPFLIMLLGMVMLYRHAAGWQARGQAGEAASREEGSA
ncbi:cytochrome c-type biogenesis protein [Noviherbaspirillum sedimenti]|uniref:Cytochrome c-type biogenesis protein n=1 Tax=Noviherbaspirillum sedimenti TaxID=2320865 RepID=A0A3A3G8F9_9BURK|nr:cytochrome c-type biogenesis protein [Noviherbaspirillum sedimenti]RJG03039.1 cytochrome c-type biogenesis protein CcmH [Noviherbaspirillum sedimenti]